MIDITRREGVLGAVTAASVPAIPPEEQSRELMLRFCSFGNNCEFGFAQRKFGAEPLDLFRWAATNIKVLMALLENRFAGIGDPGKIEVTGGPDNMMVHHTGYGFVWHAFPEKGATATDIHAREVKRLPFLARKIIEEITDASRIFVIKSITGADAAANLLLEMDVYGGRPVLMFVTDGAESPTIEAIHPRLLHGRIVRFADQTNVPKFTRPADWLALCRKAVGLIA